jgi:hypothetical protein
MDSQNSWVGRSQASSRAPVSSIVSMPCMWFYLLISNPFDSDFITVSRFERVHVCMCLCVYDSVCVYMCMRCVRNQMPLTTNLVLSCVWQECDYESKTHRCWGDRRFELACRQHSAWSTASQWSAGQSAGQLVPALPHDGQCHDNGRDDRRATHKPHTDRAIMWNCSAQARFLGHITSATACFR